MTQDQISVWDAASPDTELITAVRNGATAAFGALYERHAGAARTVARQYMSSTAGADDVVADAFTKVLTILRRGGGPDTAFRAYLFTVVRRLAYVAVNQSRRVQPTDDAGFESAFGPSASSEEPALEGFERSTVAKAYRALPERWQAALWYSEVEGLAPAEFAPSLGLTANGAAALTYRAREGLRQQYLQQHLTSAPTEDCARTNPLLAGYVREALSKRDTILVGAHLESCGECRGLLVELGDVSHGMRAIIAPLVLGLAGVGVIGGGLPLWGTAVATASTAGGAGTSTGAAAGSTGGVAATGTGTTAATSTAATSTAVTGTAVTGTAVTGTAASVAAAVSITGASVVAGAVVAAASGGGAAAGASGAATSTGVASAAASSAGVAAGGAASGIGAALAGVPALLVGAAAVLVVGAGVAVAAALGVFSGADEPAAPPQAIAPPGPLTTDGTDPAPQPPLQDPSADPTDPANTLVPDGAPSTDADAAPSPAPSAPPSAPDRTAPAGNPPSLSQATTPNPGPSSGPTGPTATPTPAPTLDPTPDPTTDPTPDPTPPPASPADLQVAFDGATMVARQDNTVELAVSNTGGTAATDVAVSLTVPDSLRFVPESSTSSGVFGPRLAVTAADGWSCSDVASSTGTHVVRCLVDEIAPGADVTLALAFYAESAVMANLTAQVFVGQVLVGAPWPFTSQIDPAPARLSATVTPVATLVAGQPGHLAVTVANGGHVAATDAQVVLTLPADSGISWRSAAGGPGVLPAPGSTPAWTCALAGEVLTCGGPAVFGDGLATVILPVQVGDGSTFVGALVPATTFTGSPDLLPAAVASRVSVAPTGLSAASILQGHLQVAHVAGPLGAPLTLELPDAVTVREATLVWSGEDAAGFDDADLTEVEVRTDAGGFARQTVTGRSTVLPSPPGGTSAYWGAADVTALVTDHLGGGRWYVAPVAGATLPADLTWSLTVVYERADLPAATVTVLHGPATTLAPQVAGSPAAPAPVSPPVLLPATGPVRVAATGVARGATDLVVNGSLLAPLPGALPDVATFRSSGLLAVSPDRKAPLALAIGPGANSFDVLVVHASTGWEEPGLDLSGVLDQPQPLRAAPTLGVDPVAPVAIGDGVTVPVTLRNGADLDLADVTLTLDLPDGVAGTVSATGCDDTLRCVIGPLSAGQASVVPLSLVAVDGLVSSGAVGYTVTGTDPVTGAQAQASGTFTVTSQSQLGIRGTWQGSVAVTEVGAPLLRCEPGSVAAGRTCALADEVAGGVAQNNHHVMKPLNAAGGTTSSSSATVDLPAGASVKHAGLYWSANRKAGEVFTQDLTVAKVRGPGTGTYQAVAGEVLGEVADGDGRVSYQSYADVTDLVLAHGAGEWSVADVALPAINYEEKFGGQDSYYGGWSLVVVYEDAALPAGTVTVLDGALPVTTESTASFSFFEDAGTATVGVVAWEGDRGVNGDRLLLNGAAMRPVVHGSTAGTILLGKATDAFDSTAWGSGTRYGNSLGVDAKKFETRPVKVGQNTVTAETTSDQYMIGVLTLTTH